MCSNTVKTGLLTVLLYAFLLACNQPPKQVTPADKQPVQPALKNIVYADTGFKVIHVFVALCDNKYQGIVPVPASIGNGQDPETNLYWGCDNGVRTYFKKSKDWQLLKKRKAKRMLLERLVFKHRTKKFYLVADAWDGQAIEKTTEDFLFSCSGQLKDTIQLDKKVIGINGNANLLAYIGHDVLMGFNLPDEFKNTDHKTRDCIILACISKKYFSGFVTKSNANPLLWTTGLMCPEAYTLHDALTGYICKEPSNEIQHRAALAYAKYQKCDATAAKKLLVTGF